MPLFALPTYPSSTRPSARSHLYPRTSRKRKRTQSPTPTLDDYRTSSPSPNPSSSLAAALTNPLSLSQDEIEQYKVAGLPLDEELPSQSTLDFPHRALPDRNPELWNKVDEDGGADGNSGEEFEGKVKTHASYLRTQHLSVLTTILHRCLLEGDIPRASRAWAMLLRAQVNGAGIDIRTTGYWGIGAELLIRGGEKMLKGKRGLDEANDSQDDSNDDSGSEDNGKDGTNSDDDDTTQNGGQNQMRRWGSSAGLQKAKEYYERLILQYPYKRQFHSSVNALDFWPAMLGCEIYGVQYEQNEALSKLDAEEEEEGDPMRDITDSEEEEDVDGTEEDRYFTSQQRREARQFEKNQDLLWQKRERIRLNALGAAEKIAGRMDVLMSLPPYSDSHVLHRLRGMLALYVGDLQVPGTSHHIAEEASDDEDNTNVVRRGKRAVRIILQQQRLVERQRGIARRAEERDRARRSFEKSNNEVGRFSEGLAKVSSLDDESLEDEEEELNPMYS